MITRSSKNYYIVPRPISAMAKQLLLIAIAVSILVIELVEARELRPTEHGLPFQNLQARSPDMMSFFGEETSSPPDKKPLSSSSPPTILEGSNSTMASSSDTWWSGTPRKNKVRKVLVIATVVCGGTGVVLLLAAAVIFLVHLYRQRSEPLSAGAVGDANNNVVNYSAPDSTGALVVTAATVPANKVTM